MQGWEEKDTDRACRILVLHIIPNTVVDALRKGGHPVRDWLFRFLLWCAVSAIGPSADKPLMELFEGR